MRVLVTGASGYLGVGIVNALVKEGVQVIATDFMGSIDMDERVNFIPSDLFTIEDPFNFFNKPDVLLHLAWRDGFKHNSSTHIQDLPKHYDFLQKMINSGIKEISVMGSMHEIGFYEGSINQDTPCNPESLYGIAKDALRKAIQLECQNKNCPFIWLRGYYIVGTSLRGSSIFSKLLLADKEGEKEFPFTLGQNQYDFLDYEEFCNQVVAVLKQNKVMGIINICSGKPQKLSERVEKFIVENKLSIRLKYGVFPERPYDSLAVWGNPHKILQILDKCPGCEKLKGGR